jgi:hypothetical protein
MPDPDTLVGGRTIGQALSHAQNENRYCYHHLTSSCNNTPGHNYT